MWQEKKESLPVTKKLQKNKEKQQRQLKMKEKLLS